MALIRCGRYCISDNHEHYEELFPNRVAFSKGPHGRSISRQRNNVKKSYILIRNNDRISGVDSCDDVEMKMEIQPLKEKSNGFGNVWKALISPFNRFVGKR